MTRLIFFADNDTTSDAQDVNAAMIKEENVDAYCFVGDGPYATSGTKWVDMMKTSFDDKKDKMIWSRGNHDTKASESWQTQDDMEAWFPECKSTNPSIDRTWLVAKQVGNTYVISMDTEDLDVEFDRDQFNWVKDELTKAVQLRSAGAIDWIVVLFHKPFFTLKSSHSPYTAVRFLYKELFRSAQVDFCVSGHNHNTQLWLPMIPNASQANGEGEQLFTKLPDGTFDFSKDHGAFFIISGHAGHEWNGISDSGGGVANVMHYRDSGKFGFTIIETNGKSAKVMSKDTDNATTFEYKVTREGTIVPPPDPCPAGQHRNEQGICVPDDIPCPPGTHKDPVNGQCVPDVPTGQPVCPRDYHFDANLKKCIPDLEPKINPVCPENYKWDSKTSQCMKTGGPPPPPPPPNCSDPAKCIDSQTGECRLIGPNEHKSPTDGSCQKNPPDGPEPCPAGQHRDPVTGLCVPDTIPEPGGDVLWDSNVHLKTGQAYTINDTHGSQEPDGKGVFMAASGNPRLHVDADGTFHLEADGGHGRVYIKARNYNARMEGELMFEDSNIRNTTLRLRSRHNMGGACENRFGGFGVTVERAEQLAETSTERCHNEHSNTVKKPLEKNIEVGQWLKFKYSCWSNADKSAINQKLEYDYNDGQGFKTVLDESFDSVEPHMMDEAKMMEESYCWLRVNNESTGKVAYRNVRIIKI